jgi:cbb3-type cytochrome oxidase subunit 3
MIWLIWLMILGIITIFFLLSPTEKEEELIYNQ